MKKRIFGCIAVLTIAAIAAVNVNLSSQKNYFSDISLANVEALATESDKGELVKCYNTITTHETKKVLYCGSCTVLPDDCTSFSGSDKCIAK